MKVKGTRFEKGEVQGLILEALFPLRFRVRADVPSHHPIRSTSYEISNLEFPLK